MGLVARSLTCLCEQDQGCRVGGLRREGEVEEDERVRVPLQGPADCVEDEPGHDDERLADDVLRRAEEARCLLRALAERVGAEGAAQMLQLGMLVFVHATRLEARTDERPSPRPAQAGIPDAARARRARAAPAR